MKRSILFILLSTAAITIGILLWVTRPDRSNQNDLLLYGNIDLRQVNLAFNGNDRIERLLVQEGDRVTKGQVLGVLEMDRLKASVAAAEANVQARRHVVERLDNGTRPEEIDQARANVYAAQTDLNNAKRIYDRLKVTAGAGASSRQDLENAKAALDVFEAKLRVNHRALDLALLGPRKEERAEAKAVLRKDEADLAALHQDLSHATLICPTDGVVQNRILEPGEMASPQRPVLTISITDPKWVRAFVPESDLGKIRLGMQAAVTSDSFEGKKYEGWVGFISPISEFTPKSVETTELRTSLVYEVRIFVNDPADELRLGMPVTVNVPLTPNPSLAALTRN